MGCVLDEARALLLWRVTYVWYPVIALLALAAAVCIMTAILKIIKAFVPSR